MFAKSSFNLSQLDTESADFHLIVCPVDILKAAIQSTADYVARTVKLCLGSGRESVIDEALCR